MLNRNLDGQFRDFAGVTSQRDARTSPANSGLMSGSLAGYRMPSQRPTPRHSLFLSDATGNCVHARSTVVRD